MSSSMFDFMGFRARRGWASFFILMGGMCPWSASSSFKKSILLYCRLSYSCKVLTVAERGFISFHTRCLIKTLGYMIQQQLEGSSF